MPKGFARHSAQYTCPGTIAPNFSLARPPWIPAVLTWDEAAGEVREGLHFAKGYMTSSKSVLSSSVR